MSDLFRDSIVVIVLLLLVILVPLTPTLIEKMKKRGKEIK